MIESGPIPAVHGVVRWRLIDRLVHHATIPTALKRKRRSGD